MARNLAKSYYLFCADTDIAKLDIIYNMKMLNFVELYNTKIDTFIQSNKKQK
jgi:hypothetical protein